MPFVSLIRWWYGLGWRDQYGLVKERIASVADFFSVSLVLRTFFAPFKQIDADRARSGPIDIVFRAMFDQLFSRVFGAVLRSFLLIFGILALSVEAVVGAIRLAVWPLLPFAPLILLPLTLSGLAL